MEWPTEARYRGLHQKPFSCGLDSTKQAWYEDELIEVMFELLQPKDNIATRNHRVPSGQP
jgi:hypothetical protein